MPATMDAQQQSFWVESINKEAAVRFEWQLRYSKKFAKDLALKEQRMPPRKQQVGVNVASNVSARIKQLEGERTKPTPSMQPTVSKPGSRASEKSQRRASIRDMRPPSVNTRSVLYDGISAHGEGRYAYLQKRKRLTPDQKYEFPVLSSCQYGWKTKKDKHSPRK